LYQRKLEWGDMIFSVDKGKIVYINIDKLYDIVYVYIDYI